MLRERYNNELANGIGNLLSRTGNMIGRYFDHKVPPVGDGGRDAGPVRAAAEALRESAPQSMARCRFHQYLETLLSLVTETNRYIDRTEPFRLAKDPAKRDQLGTILYACAEAVRIALLHLRPFMPTTADRGLAQLGWRPNGKPLSELGRWGRLQAGTRTQKSEALFPRKSATRPPGPPSPM